MSRVTGWGSIGDAFDVVLIGDASDAMADAVALAGGRVVARLGWEAPLAADAGALVAVELGGSGETPPERLADLAARADIVACAFDQLDAVAAQLLWSDAQLLCDPSPAERIAALALAAAQGGAPESAVREGDAVRLHRFSAEVARIAAVLARLAGEQGGDVADRRQGFDAGPAAAVVPDRAIDAQAVRQAIRARRLRASFLGEGLFEDPAWDMLLDLFAAELEGARVSVSSLCIAAHVAPTTALRWIGRLGEAGLFERRPDPQDRRRAFMALTPQGSQAMHGYAAALARMGLSLQ